MSPSRRRAMVAAAAMLGSVAAAESWRPTRQLAADLPRVDLAAAFPIQFGEWSELKVASPIVSPDVRELLQRIYSQTLARVYVDGHGQMIMLSVAYGGDQSDATRTHRPEVCYPAQGFQTRDNERVTLPAAGRTVNARRLVAQLGPRIEPITYWVVVGERTASSGTEQKLAQMSYGLRGVIPDGMLVRVSSIDDNTSRAYGTQQRFIAALALAVEPGVAARIFGSAAAPATVPGA